MQEIDLKVKPHFVDIYKDGHPLISKESLEEYTKVTQEGIILNLYDTKNRFIAKGYHGLQNKGFGWILSYKKEESIDVTFFKKKIKQAIVHRKKYIEDKETTAYRLFNGEGDGIGGLTIDLSLIHI